MKKIWTLLFVTVLFAGCSFDDNDLWRSIDELEEKMKKLEEKVNGMNTEISSMDAIVQAINNGKTIKTITTSAEKHTLVFSDGTTIEVMNAQAGSAPKVGVKSEDGTYYWTLTVDGKTEWLNDNNGEKIAAGGTAPELGVDPDGYWTIDVGHGPVRITDSDRNPIKADGDAVGSLFRGVTQDENQVTFILPDGTEITVPKTGGVNFTVTGAQEALYFLHGETRTFTVTQSGVEQVSISKPDGWRVSLEGDKLTVISPADVNPFAEPDGNIDLIAVGKNSAMIVSMNVSVAAYNYLMTFETVPASCLAGPGTYGENLYSEYGAGQYIGYYDAVTDLSFSINEDYGSIDYWNGGTAVSRWNDMTTETYSNQCSVFYTDPNTGFGGRNGSQTFGVVNGNAEIGFGTSGAAHLLDHVWIANSTYGVLTMENGNGFSKKFSYEDQDWLKVIITGYNPSGAATGSVEYYLADFRTADAPGIETGWKKADLSSLGNVSYVVFGFESSDAGEWGMNTPAYCCIDDIAIRK